MPRSGRPSMSCGVLARTPPAGGVRTVSASVSSSAFRYCSHGPSQTSSAHQDLPPLRSPLRMAAEVGAGVGGGGLVLRPLSAWARTRWRQGGGGHRGGTLRRPPVPVAREPAFVTFPGAPTPPAPMTPLATLPLAAELEDGHAVADVAGAGDRPRIGGLSKPRARQARGGFRMIRSPFHRVASRTRAPWFCADAGPPLRMPEHR